MFNFIVVEKKTIKRTLEEKTDSNEDELNDLKITRKILKNSIEDKFNDESDVIEQKNLRLSNIEKYH